MITLNESRPMQSLTDRIFVSHLRCAVCALVAFCLSVYQDAAAQQEAVVELPRGVEAVWDVDQAYHALTETRERICINGLWRWQPASADSDAVPEAEWGYFKVPGCWPGITDYMQKDCQTVFAHPQWRDDRLGRITAAWYQREITVPAEWAGRRIGLQAQYVNSFATVFLDGAEVGKIRYPAGEVDLTAQCRPGSRHMLSMLVVAMPLRGVMLSFRDTASARQVRGQVARRGLCGDVYLSSTPAGPRISDVKVVTSVRNWRLSVDAALESLADDVQYVLQASVLEGDKIVRTVTSDPFGTSQLEAGRFKVAESWKPQKLWDVHTPQNMYRISLTLREAHGKTLDTSLPVRFGFREFWIDGRDFYLNGTRIFLSSVPLDNAQIGAAWATYDAARESMQRLASFGINFVYTHNYGCEPGSHLSFAEILRAADDVGMLVSFSQPHFSHYEWNGPDAAQTNGYAQHAAFYVRAAQNHPSVVAYSTSHNATGYAEDMNPDMIDGVRARRNEWSVRNVQRAMMVESIIKGLDSSRIVYHHASGNLGSMHTSNFYANLVPVQEMSDWFEHWSKEGVKPLFTCEYSVPMPWDWTMYRGWYQGKREFGSAAVPWEFCVAEWNAQFFGDRAYQISEEEKRNLRWEARKYRAGNVWHRWDYPHQVGSSDFAERYPIYAEYFADNWPAFRTWEVSANSPWNHGHYWTLRLGVDKDRQELSVAWQDLQRPGFSPDYIQDRYEQIELAYDRSDWIPTVAAETLIRNNRPLLAYIAGKPQSHTSKDHNFCAGEVVEKQIVVINNSRETVRCVCQWSFNLRTSAAGQEEVTVATGQQQRLTLRCKLPDQLAAGQYTVNATFRFSTGETQEDTFTLDVLPRPASVPLASKIAVFDPLGETRQLLDTMEITYAQASAEADLSSYELLVVGKNALNVNGPAPDIRPVREGLKVLLFEQSPEVLEKRFGFRVQTYGLRRVFQRVPDHALLSGMGEEHFCDWRGAATIVPPRLDYTLSPQFNETPAVRWCGIPVSRLWRCGNRGNVASVLIEKPARGDFLPILDGGYSLQYSPLLEYREGDGMVLFCQVDVTGRTERDPAAELLARNLLQYASSWQPAPRREALYVGDPAWKNHLELAGIPLGSYQGGRPADAQVLVVGPGGASVLAPHSEAIAQWLKAGGHLLALGLNDNEATAFLPMEISTQDAEHIAAYFDPPPAGSLLAGVSPAEVHNPAPRQMPLLTGVTGSKDIAVMGDGILGIARDVHVVLCQLPPDSVSSTLGKAPSTQHNLKRTYRRNCFFISRLLGNMGVAGATPLLERFSTSIDGNSETSVVQNGSFAADGDNDGMPDQWLFSPNTKVANCGREPVRDGADEWSLVLDCPPVESEKKSSTMVAQHDVPVKKGQWYRISLRARAEKLAENSVTLTITNTASWRSFFDYQRFQPGPEWEPQSFEVQSNDTAEQGTRFQIWYNGEGKLWLSDVRVEPITDPAQGRWLEGFYLDTPEEWDDPYRFFRW